MILLVYVMAVRLWGDAYRWAGAVAALWIAVNPLLIRLVSGTIPTDHIDTHTAFFVQSAVFVSLRTVRGTRKGWMYMLGVVLGLAFLCKSFAALMVVPTCLLLMWSTQTGWSRNILQLARVGAAFLSVALPWQLYSAVHWPAEYKWESAYTLSHLFKPVEDHAHPPSFYLSLVPTHYGGIAWVTVTLIGAVVVGAIVWGARRRDRCVGALVIWILSTYLFFSIVGTKLYSYVAPIVPAVALLVSWTVVSLARGATAVRPGAARVRSGRSGLITPVFIVLFLLLAVQLGSAAAERLEADCDRCPWNMLYDHLVFRTELKKLSGVPGEKVIFNVGDWKEIQAMYYAECPAYPNVPTPEQLRELQARGFRVFLLIDVAGRHGEQIASLHRAGLLESVQGIRIPGPRPGPPRHPYYY